MRVACSAIEAMNEVKQIPFWEGSAEVKYDEPGGLADLSQRKLKQGIDAIESLWRGPFHKKQLIVTL